MGYYPIFLALAGRPCLVIGGGAVAERKVEGLLAQRAVVTVISPTLTARLEELAADGRIRRLSRAYSPGDLAGYQLAFVATDDAGVNAAVAREGRERGVWVNAADDPEHCDFILPSVLRRGELTVAVATGGASPALSRVIREELEGYFGEEYAALAGVVAEVRRELRACGRNPSGETWRRALNGDLRRLLAEGRGALARRRLLERLEGGIPAGGTMKIATGRVGRVAIVGAGPGDPGLMTVRGLELLRQADVVIYDRLVNPSLLDEAPPHALRIFAGKWSGTHYMPQEQIHALLIAQARRGRRVVRLKGGDPFVFGRGGEEAAALAEAGIPFEVVPGVSSAVAVPAYAGIPLTHRGLSSSFAVVTGHEDASKGRPAVDWGRLASAVDTLVVLMGLRALPGIVASLLAHGRSPETPVALVRWGTTAEQATVIGVLADIVERARAAGLEPPVVAVIGEVVRLRDRLQWFEEAPPDLLLELAAAVGPE